MINLQTRAGLAGRTRWIYFIFHLEKSLEKTFVKRRPFKENLESDWMNPPSVTSKAGQSDSFTASQASNKRKLSISVRTELCERRNTAVLKETAEKTFVRLFHHGQCSVNTAAVCPGASCFSHD